MTTYFTRLGNKNNTFWWINISQVRLMLNIQYRWDGINKASPLDGDTPPEHQRNTSPGVGAFTIAPLPLSTARNSHSCMTAGQYRA